MSMASKIIRHKHYIEDNSTDALDPVSVLSNSILPLIVYETFHEYVPQFQGLQLMLMLSFLFWYLDINLDGIDSRQHIGHVCVLLCPLFSKIGVHDS